MMVIMLAGVVMVVEVLDMVLVITGYDAVTIIVMVGVAASEVYMVNAGSGGVCGIIYDWHNRGRLGVYNMVTWVAGDTE